MANGNGRNGNGDHSITEVTTWFERLAYQQVRGPVSVLVDSTDIGLGMQRREIRRGRPAINGYTWMCGFPDSNYLGVNRGQS